jgi:hypothetical protein
VSAAVPGHGYREVVIPECKCGWTGQKVYGPNSAHDQFERHKASIRHKLGMDGHPSKRKELPPGWTTAEDRRARAERSFHCRSGDCAGCRRKAGNCTCRCHRVATTPVAQR